MLSSKEPRRALFLCVFADYSNKILHKNVFSAEAVLFPVYTLMVGKHVLWKTAYLPNRTCVGASLIP